MSGEREKRYWKSLEEREASGAAVEDEFPERTTQHFSRRGFLKAAGFTAAGTLLTGCSRAPVEKAIPYLIKPEEITPGRAYYYASTCAGCAAGCGMMVKNRDGRPIKLEGNPEHPMSRGGLCAAGQASILGLYDSLRLRHPLREGKQATWPEIDRRITAELENIRKQGGAVRFLSGTITSPTLRWAIERFLGGFSSARHVIYDPLSSSAILDAHERTHGVRELPRYRFERAEVIAGFDADFLGTWISPVEFTAGYNAGRDLQGMPPRLSYHIQFEPRMSLTGSKAGRRVAIAPEQQGALISGLATRLSDRARDSAADRAATVRERSSAGVPPPGAGRRDGGGTTEALLDELAERLWQARGHSLVISGSQDVDVQVLCNFINHVLGNYGATLDLERPSHQRRGNDRELAALLDEIYQNKVGALFIAGANPVYDLPEGEKLAGGLRRVPLVVSFAERVDETASAARYVCPDHHALESWSDAEPVAGIVSLAQPVIHPLANTRSILESLGAWSVATGIPVRPNQYDIIRQHWEQHIFPRQSRERSFQDFWDRAVHDGHAEVEPVRVSAKPFNLAAVRPISNVSATTKDVGKMPALQLVLYPKVGMLDGRHAHNAWLHELPDPISKVTWDNYACLSPAAAARLGVQEGDVVRLEMAGRPAVELPVFLQPGQHDLVVAVALGYGRKGTERFANIGPRWLFGRPSVGDNGLVGKNAAPFLVLRDGALRYASGNVALTKTGRKYQLASTQSHQTIEVPKNLKPAGAEPRPVIQETTLAAFSKDPAAGRRGPGEEPEELWPRDHPYTGHRWGMVIDLNACTGCSACVIACQVENNIPVVGKDEVRRRRQMHWMRIDRYYSEPSADRPPGLSSGQAGGLSPQADVAHQPMFCQQCDHAPCETVCPVLATVHSSEGLNQQIYNRCVGTRYCANNCPYKTRRFNWFDYSRDDRLQHLVLNPDVTVRSRGVMEKCTFCVQRIQEAKIEAKRRGEPVADGAIQPACQQSCPAQAITFGDLNDSKSKVSQLMANPRRYRVLEELNVQPSVGYLRLVRNREVTSDE